MTRFDLFKSISSILHVHLDTLSDISLPEIQEEDSMEVFINYLETNRCFFKNRLLDSYRKYQTHEKKIAEFFEDIEENNLEEIAMEVSIFSVLKNLR